MILYANLRRNSPDCLVSIKATRAVKPSSPRVKTLGYDLAVPQGGTGRARYGLRTKGRTGFDKLRAGSGAPGTACPRWGAKSPTSANRRQIWATGYVGFSRQLTVKVPVLVAIPPGVVTRILPVVAPKGTVAVI